jgi:hypothetical protein
MPITGASANRTDQANASRYVGWHTDHSELRDGSERDDSRRDASGNRTVDVTAEATAQLEVTSLATEAADAPLHFISFLPTDMKFNPATISQSLW